MHILIVGGTGMLSSLTEQLARTHTISLIARHASTSRLASLEYVFAYDADYSDDAHIREVLACAIAQNGVIDQCILWIHSYAAHIVPMIAAHTRGAIYDIIGSTTRDPRMVHRWDHPRYHRILLGYVREGERSRWLTDAEICAGVQAGIEADGSSVVGMIEPWDQRPS